MLCNVTSCPTILAFQNPPLVATWRMQSMWLLSRRKSMRSFRDQRATSECTLVRGLAQKRTTGTYSCLTYPSLLATCKAQKRYIHGTKHTCLSLQDEDKAADTTTHQQHHHQRARGYTHARNDGRAGASGAERALVPRPLPPGWEGSGNEQMLRMRML